MPRKATRPTPKTSTASSRGGKVELAVKAAPKNAEARVQAFLESGKPALKRAQALVSQTSRRLSKQTQALRSDLAHRVSDLGTRVEKERKSLGRKVEGAVKTTLASLNIPTRSEINLLARRVEELSRKIDGLKRR
ncbi:MAG: phasin family protein [Vicinamibacteria bacterium]|nr:phasin family protein [Vicinamibacteria bacterium]